MMPADGRRQIDRALASIVLIPAAGIVAAFVYDAVFQGANYSSTRHMPTNYPRRAVFRDAGWTIPLERLQRDATLGLVAATICLRLVTLRHPGGRRGRPARPGRDIINAACVGIAWGVVQLVYSYPRVRWSWLPPFDEWHPLYVMNTSWIFSPPAMILGAWTWSAASMTPRRGTAPDLIDRCGLVVGVCWLASTFGIDMLHCLAYH